jgi:UMP-CMP kinase
VRRSILSTGSGKGTQSALMEQNYPVAHFSVGELLRNVPDDSPHKATIDAKLVAGQIVPVEISLSLLRAAMEATPSKHTLFLVDGFPRNYDNLSGWCRVMSQVAALESVLVYQCPFPVLQERILERAKISGRSDDNIESVKKRFKTFESETVPVVEVLRSVSEHCPPHRQRWSVVDISGDRSLEDVWASTQQILNQLIQSDVLTANAALLAAIQMRDVKAYERLCDPLFFKDADVTTIMQRQEGKGDEVPDVQSAEIEILSGRQVTVCYDRLIDGVLLQEKRFWSHQGIAGWRNVHFVRTPKHGTCS